MPGMASALAFRHSQWLRMGAWGNTLALAPYCQYTFRCRACATSSAHPCWIVGIQLRNSTKTAFVKGPYDGCGAPRAVAGTGGPVATRGGRVTGAGITNEMLGAAGVCSLRAPVAAPSPRRRGPGLAVSPKLPPPE